MLFLLDVFPLQPLPLFYDYYYFLSFSVNERYFRSTWIPSLFAGCYFLLVSFMEECCWIEELIHLPPPSPPSLPFLPLSPLDRSIKLNLLLGPCYSVPVYFQLGRCVDNQLITLLFTCNVIVTITRDRFLLISVSLLQSVIPTSVEHGRHLANLIQAD